MPKHILRISLIIGLIFLIPIRVSTSLKQKNKTLSNQAQLPNHELSKTLNLHSDFGRIPLYFIPNTGQVDEKALHYAKTSRYTLWLTTEGLVFDSTRRIRKEVPESMRLGPREENDPEDFIYERDVSKLVFVNANRNPEVIALDETEHKVNYLLGKDKSKWRTNMQTSRAVLYRELYPHIDLKVYGIEKQIEYDFVVKPGGKASDINIEYKAVEKMRIDKEGDLVVETKLGELEHAKPKCYQLIEGERIKVKAEFKKIENDTYGFKVEKYNKNYELIIDPLVLVYSSYLGGSDADEVNDIAVDSEGAVYVTGRTFSSDFPTQNPIQGNFAGGPNDVFIAKVNASGTDLIYSTYLGGSDTEFGGAIAVDSDGAAYVAGMTFSSDFPTQEPIQGSYGGGYNDVFITKINSSGSALIYSTYLGGSDSDTCHGIAVDSDGAAYVVGNTDSADFPTYNPIQGSYLGDDDVFIAKVNASGTALVYSTYLGGSASDNSIGIAVDSDGAAYVVGNTSSADFPTHNPIQGTNLGDDDVFIAKVNALGTALVYSTYLGGSAGDISIGIAVDSEGAVYVSGTTGSLDFPTQEPIQGTNAGLMDVFIAKVNSTGTDLIYSTYMGGSDNDTGRGIAVDSAGAVYVAGYTDSVDFPVQNPVQGTNAGLNDVFITKVNAPGTALIYSTYLGGSGNDYGEGIAVDSEGAAYVTGLTLSVDFPIQNPIQGTNAGDEDAFIAKIGSSKGIRIVSWNILNYPDLSEKPREELFQSVLEYLAPDILVVQEMTSFYGVDEFLKKVLKPISKKYKASNFFDGPDSDNALFYDKSKIKLKSRQQILTSFRDISEYSLKIKKGPEKGSKLKIYSVHFTEGLTASDKSQRENEANTLRTYLNGLPPGSLFLVCGTFNMTGSDEEAYNILTGDQIINIGRAKDPINKAGKWHDNKKSRDVHTESTRKSEFGGGASEGLDDRFDMILISYSLDQDGKLIYRPGSYVIYGNDGKHFNKAINKPKNRVVSPEMAEALYEASDHLPIIIELVSSETSN